MNLIYFLIILIQTQLEIPLKRSSPTIVPFFGSKNLKERIYQSSDNFYVGGYYFYPKRFIYVTDTFPIFYNIISYNWNISDTIFWFFYLPDNDTLNGAPTGNYVRAVRAYWTHTYEDTANCLSYWEYFARDIWRGGRKGWIRFVVCGSGMNDFEGGWGIRVHDPSDPRRFLPTSFYPGKWKVELWRHPAGGSLYFLKRDSFEVKDNYVSLKIYSPSSGDTVIGRSKILLEILENHWAQVNLTVSSVPVLKEGKYLQKEEVWDTSFIVYRLRYPSIFSIPCNFGFDYRKRYRIIACIRDYSGNEDIDSVSVIVGKPVMDVVLNPQEVMPDDIPSAPLDGNRTEVIIKVKTKAGEPLRDFPINLSARAVPYSGGHDHDGNRPVGRFEQSQGNTDENGEFRTYYYATQFGGIERIIAKGQEISDSADLTVRVPGLILLYDYPDYIKVGGTQNHHGPPNYQDDHNHWGQSYLIDAIYAIALNYVDEGGEVILINDISLPYGGLFDINGNWTVPHSTHRMGQNADIEGTGEEGKFRKPQEIEEIINEVAEAFGINISYFWESTHYHFTITQGR
ncbi:MAG: hypothetical protein NC926_10655 [Candidatus Omnitrophica bacterium]|nr:hypothetical protein [Candidatus Omnitrophota bacterium]